MIDLLQLKPQNILVRMPNWLGDLVMSTPVLKELRERWPEAKITACCRGTLGSIIQEDPNLNAIINFNPSKHWFATSTEGDIIDSLKKGQYDLGLLLTNSFSSALMFYKGCVKHRLGYADNCRSFLLNHSIPYPEARNSQHLVSTYKMLLRPLGIPLSGSDPTLYITKQETAHASKQLLDFGFSPDDIIVGINPGAAYGSAKCWLPDRFKAVAEKLLKKPNVKVIFFGDRDGTPLVDEICKNLPQGALNLAGKTSIRELMAYLSQCDLLLTNDSGPMHMASALGVPLLALFGPTDDTTTGPYKKERVIHKHVPCSPCHRRECPIDFRCMTRISVEEVYGEIQDILKTI